MSSIASWCLVLFLLIAPNLNAQIKVHLVPPAETGPEIQTVYNHHVAMYRPNVKSRKKLVIAIPGTTGRAIDLAAFDSLAAELGYHALSLDYINKVSTAVFIKSEDPEAFNKFRQEVVFGTPASDSVQVDSSNSIYNRVVHLVRHLATAHPEEGWGHYLQSDGLRWSDVIIAGHSQGAGAAAYLAHFYPCDRVIMLAGPQDFRIPFQSPATWTSLPSKTPRKRYLAFLHQNDPYGVKNQLRSFYNMSGQQESDVQTISDKTPPAKKSQAIVTRYATPDPHNSVTRPVFREVWKYLLR
jgi:hypothetical protein